MKNQLVSLELIGYQSPDMKPKTYYTLAEFDTRKQAWFPQFGDYNRSAVASEERELRAQGILSCNLAIVASLDDQESINQAIAAL